MRLSLRLALMFALCSGAVVGALVVSVTRSAKQEAYTQTERLGSVTLAAVRALVMSEARQGRLTELGRRFEELVLRAQIATIVVRDSRGKRLVGRSDDPKLAAHTPQDAKTLSGVHDGVYFVDAPVDLGTRGRGIVLVGFRTTALERRLSEIRARGVQLGVSAFLAITLMAWLIGMFAGERMERLVGRLEAMASNPGQFRRLAGAQDGRDELSRLIRAFNKMGLRLQAETKRREALEEEKKELTAMLVHDLKAPMTVIRSGIALLSEYGKREGSQAQARTFELLEMSTTRLQRMVEDILQLAKLEETQGLQNQESVDLLTLAQACAKDFELVMADRKQTISVHHEPDILPPVAGDSSLLRRVFDNLVFNAVEHTPRGGAIRINVIGEGSCVRVDVIDSGPGVPIEARKDIFAKFFQTDVKRHVGNVGLGLALCEKVILRHGGSIGIEDAVPRGARFYFILPIVRAATSV